MPYLCGLWSFTNAYGKRICEGKEEIYKNNRQLEFNRDKRTSYIANDGSTIYFCLSKQNDVLSQWRSYADDGRGISLGIDVNILLKQSNKLKGNDIIYDKKEQINLLNEKIKDKVLDELEKAIDSKNENDIFNKSRILISHILNETVICKNPAFQEEKRV